MRDVDRKLKTLRSALQEGLKNGAIQQKNGFLEISNFATLHEIEGVRDTGVQKLNAVLRSAGMDEV